MQHSVVLRGQLLKRYKRFLADVYIGAEARSQDVEATTVFFPNTGPLPGLLDR